MNPDLDVHVAKRKIAPRPSLLTSGLSTFPNLRSSNKKRVPSAENRVPSITDIFFAALREVIEINQVNQMPYSFSKPPTLCQLNPVLVSGSFCPVSNRMVLPRFLCYF